MQPDIEDIIPFLDNTSGTDLNEIIIGPLFHLAMSLVRAPYDFFQRFISFSSQVSVVNVNVDL